MQHSARSARSALIGHTGFVGSNIARHHMFDDLYNTSNIDAIVGREYDLVVSAAGRADAHRINESPDDDKADLRRFADVLAEVRIGKLVHISTVCVFAASGRCDEETRSDPAALTPYGRNRLELENELTSRFDTLSLRLPQLFGHGIRKGLVHDLANDHRVEFVRADGVFQHYDLARLWRDIGIALDAGLEVLNVATAPITNRVVAEEVFGIELSNDEPVVESPFSTMYTRDMVTRHAALFGGSGGYIMTAAEELDAMRRFVADEQRGAMASGQPAS